MNFRNPFIKIILFSVTFGLSFVMTLSIRVAKGVKSTEPIPVSLEPLKKVEKVDPIVIKLQWGGYYAVRKEEGFRIFRLLDINPNTYHIVSYNEIFREMPNVNEVTYLIPEFEHRALDSIEILKEKPVYFGRRTLSSSELLAYANYLKVNGMRGNELTAHLSRVIRFSRETPLETKLAYYDGALSFEQPGAH